ncbi:hypothetical protein SAMN04490239_3700 [Rhodococcus koreensis]|jgi:hypothetical protein|uniref:Uncharacterized protein n=2 Tax=Rhodococcus koreensis TaxID=99653 RepID=A0A1H4RMD4_9NOCA|nr:hypothetical protein SAMN04490239_3700 [Rhodococcus koreensis]
MRIIGEMTGPDLGEVAVLLVECGEGAGFGRDIETVGALVVGEHVGASADGFVVVHTAPRVGSYAIPSGSRPVGPRARSVPVSVEPGPVAGQSDLPYRVQRQRPGVSGVSRR